MPQWLTASAMLPYSLSSQSSDAQEWFASTGQSQGFLGGMGVNVALPVEVELASPLAFLGAVELNVEFPVEFELAFPLAFLGAVELNVEFPVEVELAFPFAFLGTVEFNVEFPVECELAFPLAFLGAVEFNEEFSVEFELAFSLALLDAVEFNVKNPVDFELAFTLAFPLALLPVALLRPLSSCAMTAWQTSAQNPDEKSGGSKKVWSQTTESWASAPHCVDVQDNKSLKPHPASMATSLSISALVHSRKPLPVHCASAST